MEIPEMMSWIGSLIAMVAFLRGIVPREYTDHITDRLQDFVSPYSYFVVPEYEGTSANELYVAVQTYLSSLTRQRARMSNMWMEKNAKGATFSMVKNQRIRDTFEKVRVEWIHHMEERRNTVWMGWDGNTDERRYFRIKMPRQQRDLILDSYVSYILKEAKILQRSNRELNLYGNRKLDRGGTKGGWNSMPFKHPAGFDTIAIDPEQKLGLINDLDRFAHGEEFYRRVGKSWKRGYLLFGPPGTGKTSIIAAIANHLRYDVYDLELTEVQSNADLRKLLLHTSNKSIVVIEDIDCSLDLSGQRKKKKKSTPTEGDAAPTPTKPDDDDKPSKVTLSGLLNFTDGLWSCCGSERIFIFTTNFIHKLDPALLRPGRMDMHINLTYCRYEAFKILARNFLQVNKHPLFSDVEEIIDASFMTPAEVAEILTKDRTDPDLALDLLVKALHDSKNNPPPPPKEEDDEADNSVESGAATLAQGKTVEEKTTPPLPKEEKQEADNSVESGAATSEGKTVEEKTTE